jgi:predicted HTH domain antitoxin
VSKTGGKYVMTALTLTIPDSSFSALRRSPTEFAHEIKLAAAIHGYQRGVMSQERAAELAGLNRRDFIHALAREGMEVFILDNASLARELGMECGAQFGSV